ncbi:glycoside hydrolase family 19 protein [Pseudomonas sp.]|jgi:putative chitinase|uniref:glycoside hydrolase family 19 protein n=1 Tax=Pseudomonas sp. TaxID=306 RepID=UPI002ED7B869
MSGAVTLTAAQLQSLCTVPYARKACVQFVDPINEHAATYGLNTRLRLAALLAQALHETTQFQFLHELGSQAYLAKYDTGSLATQLGNTPEADGDGQLYKGRGLGMITGLANYTAMGKAMGLDLINHPEQLEEPGPAVESFCIYWGSRKLSPYADAGNIDKISRLINGGTNGLAERRAFYTAALGVLA